jgi:hypothetical protein
MITSSPTVDVDLGQIIQVFLISATKIEAWGYEPGKPPRP